MLNITDVKIYPFDTSSIGGKIRAYAEITVDNCLVIKGFKIIEAEGGGLFVGYPNYKTKDGKYKDLLILLDNKAKESVRRAIIDKYREGDAEEDDFV